MIKGVDKGKIWKIPKVYKKTIEINLQTKLKLLEMEEGMFEETKKKIGENLDLVIRKFWIIISKILKEYKRNLLKGTD